MAKPFEPYWQRVNGQGRCQECGSFVAVSWRWFAEPHVWTRCYCESCVAAMITKHEHDIEELLAD